MSDLKELATDLLETSEHLEKERALIRALLVQCYKAVESAESGDFGKPSWGVPMKRLLAAAEIDDFDSVRDLIGGSQ